MNFGPTAFEERFFAGVKPRKGLLRRRRARDWNPDQPRDEKGQWTAGSGETLFSGKGWSPGGEPASHVDHFAPHKHSGDPEATAKEIAKNLPRKKPDQIKAERRLFENAAASHMARTSGITNHRAATKLAYHIASAAGYSHEEANKMAPRIADHYRQQKGYQLKSFAETTASGDRFSYSIP